jgi:hypothetical protein
MSLVTIPDGYLPLAQACGPKHDIEAICTEGLGIIGEFVWSTAAGVAFYNDFSSDCSTAGGTGCPGPGKSSPQPNSADTKGLYAWGYSNDDSWNNRIIWTNPGAAFVLNHIEVATNDLNPPILLGSGKKGVLQGIGVCPTWEWSNQSAYSQMCEQLIRIKVAANNSLNVKLLPQYSVGQGWYDAGNTLPTPINLSTELAGLTNRVVGAGETVNFRLCPSTWHGENSALPDTIYAPLRIRIYGTPT